MNYLMADTKLRGRNMLSRKMGNNTYLVRNSGVPGDSIHLKFHNTYIITWYADGRIELNTGGWLTVTTKARINEYLSGYSISQHKGVWYLSERTDGPECWKDLGVYADGMIINPDMTITGMSPLEDSREKNKLRRLVAQFTKHYIQEFKQGKVLAPSNGDCWYCLMRTVNGNIPLGEVTKDKDHILSHLEENYYVPSLLQRAFETLPHSPAMGWALAKHWGGQDIPVPEFIYGQLQKNLSKYILRQLGQVA